MRFWLALVLGLRVLHASAQPLPDALPDGLRQAQQEMLQELRQRLLRKREEVVSDIGRHNGNCGSVPADSPLVPVCAASAQRVQAAIGQYRNDLQAYHKLLEEETIKAVQWRATCARARQHLESVRAEMARNQRTNRMSQEELQLWTNLNKDAQKEALMSALRFFLSEYASKLGESVQALGRLDANIQTLIAKSVNTKNLGRRQEYAKKIVRMMEQMRPMLREAGSRWGAQTLADADTLWSLASNTLKEEFRVASRTNENIREMLRDPEFKESFAGGEFDRPAIDLLSSLADKAIEESEGVLTWVKNKGVSISAAGRAATFVRDVSYSAMASLLSTQRVLQQNEVAGILARAAGALQAEYKRSVDVVLDCRKP